MSVSSGMLIPPGPVRVLVAMKPVDFRKGMNGLAALLDLLIPLETSRQGKARLLGRHGPLPALQASGGR